MNNVTLQQYWDMLNRHDWMWPMSDDGRVYNEGRKKEADLRKIAEENDVFYSIMFKQFSDHNWTGKPWNTEQTPKPVRPT